MNRKISYCIWLRKWGNFFVYFFLVHLTPFNFYLLPNWRSSFWKQFMVSAFVPLYALWLDYGIGITHYSHLSRQAELTGRYHRIVWKVVVEQNYEEKRTRKKGDEKRASIKQIYRYSRVSYGRIILDESPPSSSSSSSVLQNTEHIIGFRYDT